MKKEEIYQPNTDVLPPCGMYADNLQLAANKFKISVNGCRNRYGSFTIKQWNDLLSK